MNAVTESLPAMPAVVAEAVKGKPRNVMPDVVVLAAVVYVAFSLTGDLAGNSIINARMQGRLLNRTRAKMVAT